ncbi:MAG: hypothetical protein IT379_40905 [Deltaproteobacteria bacterium]|nr:hypothetical protein [Deltaproteobacteria bacterium]
MAHPIRALGKSLGSVLAALVTACCVAAFGQHALGLVRSSDVDDTVLGSAGMLVCALFAPFAALDVLGSLVAAVRDTCRLARRAREAAARPEVRRVQVPTMGPYRSSTRPVLDVAARRRGWLRIGLATLALLGLGGAIAAHLGCAR